MRLKISIFLSVISVVIAACDPTPTPSASVSGLQIWIDAPLSGAHLPLALYDVTSHAAGAGGIASFELSVNGQVIRTDTVDPSQAGQTLVYIHQAWTPPATGVYKLAVRAADKAGVWSPSAEVRVIVDARTTPTHTPRFSATPTDVPRLTATPTSSRPAATDSATLAPRATDTATLAPRATDTATSVPRATDTATSVPRATDTATSVPRATNTAPRATLPIRIVPTATFTLRPPR